jgi:Holliday junction resolvasome RuvABC endonuclease subunit
MVAEATVLAVVAVLLGGMVYFGTQILRRINQVTSSVDQLQSDADACANLLTAVATAQREDGGHLAQLHQDLTVVAAHVSDVKIALAGLQPITKEQLDAELAVRLGRLADEGRETTAAIASLRERGPRFDSPVTRLTFQESLDPERFAEASATSATTSLTRLLADHTADGIVVAIQSVRLTQQGAEMILSASAAGRQLLREGKAVIPFHSVTGARLPLLTDVRTGKIIEHLKEMPVSAVTSKLASISSMVVGVAHLVAGADLAKRLSRLESKLDFMLAARRIDQFAILERVYVSARELALREMDRDRRLEMWRLRGELRELRLARRQEFRLKLERIEDPANASWFERLFSTDRSIDQRVRADIHEGQAEVAFIEYSMRLEYILAVEGGTFEEFQHSQKDELEQLDQVRNLLQEKAAYISGRYHDISVEPVVQALSAVVTAYRELLPNPVALDQDVLDVDPSA